MLSRVGCGAAMIAKRIASASRTLGDAPRRAPGSEFAPTDHARADLDGGLDVVEGSRGTPRGAISSACFSRPGRTHLRSIAARRRIFFPSTNQVVHEHLSARGRRTWRRAGPSRFIRRCGDREHRTSLSYFGTREFFYFPPPQHGGPGLFLLCDRLTPLTYRGTAAQDVVAWTPPGKGPSRPALPLDQDTDRVLPEGCVLPRRGCS